jgi:hypothetical protein
VFKEQLGEFGLFVERANDRILLDPHDLAFRQRRCAGDAPGLSGQASFAAKLILAEDGDDRFLAASGSDRDLDLALLNVKNRIRDGSLREDFLVLPVLGNRASFTNIGEEGFWVKRLFVAYRVGPLLGIEFKARVFQSALRVDPQSC